MAMSHPCTEGAEKYGPGTIYKTCGTIFRTCETIFKTCGTIFKTCGTISKTCGTTFETCGTIYQTEELQIKPEELCVFFLEIYSAMLDQLESKRYPEVKRYLLEMQALWRNSKSMRIAASHPKMSCIIDYIRSSVSQQAQCCATTECCRCWCMMT